MGFTPASDAVLIAILNVLTAFNVLCSLLTLWVVWKGIPKVTTYIKLIVLLTIYQLGFDLGLFIFNFATDEQDKTVIFAGAAQIFVGAFFGICCALFSLVVGVVLSIIVIRRMYFDLAKHLNLIHIVIVTIGLSISIPLCIYYCYGMLEEVHVGLEIYDAVRVFVIGSNVLILTFTYVRSMSGTFKSYKVNPVKVLMKRLALYPAVQVICRLPVQIYQTKYNRPMISYFAQTHPSPTEVGLFISSIATVGFGGFGNMIVFMLVQPEAQSYIKGRVVAFLELIGQHKAAAKIKGRPRSMPLPSRTLDKSGPNEDKLRSYATASKDKRVVSLGAGAGALRLSNDSYNNRQSSIVDAFNHDERVGSEIGMEDDNEMSEDEEKKGDDLRMSAIVEEQNSESSRSRVLSNNTSNSADVEVADFRDSDAFLLMDEDELAKAIVNADSGAGSSAHSSLRISRLASFSNHPPPEQPPHTLKLNFRGDLVVEMRKSSGDSLSSSNASSQVMSLSHSAKAPSRNPSVASQRSNGSGLSPPTGSPSALTMALSMDEATSNPMQGSGQV